MFTLGDVLMISFLVMVITSIATMLIACLSLANGNDRRVEQAYREGFLQGQKYPEGEEIVYGK